MKKLILFTIIIVNTNFVHAQWQNTNIPVQVCITCFATNDSNVFAGTNGLGVLLSTNNGGSWTAINTGLTDLTINSLALNGSDLWAGTNGGVFLSSNNGNTWTALNNGLSNIHISSFAISGSNIFAGSYNSGVFLSTNNGGLWTSVNNGLTNTQVYSLAISGTNLFAGTQYEGGVFLSTNNGGLWTSIDSGLTNKNIRSLAISGSNIFAGSDSVVFLSTNNGGLWTAVNNGLTNINQIWGFAIIGSNIFVSTWHSGVFLSTNNGGLWTAINTGLTGQDLDVVTLAISGTTLFAGVCSNYGAIWSRPVSEVTGIEEKIGNVNFTLFPNPTTGMFRLENPELRVQSLAAYNVLGEKVFQSANLNQQTSIEIDLSVSPKGIYFVKIYGGKEIYTEKIVVQ